MTTYPFHFIDVFADRALAGNPLTLVPDADGLNEVQMRAIAREFNQSETTFLVAPTLPGADRQLRSFTPGGFEVLGAGHNAMGAWLWLAASGELDAGRTDFVQQIGSQLLPVRVDRSGARAVVTMDQSPPTFHAELRDRAELAASLGLDPGDLAGDVPPQVVATGVTHLMIPVTTRAAVDRAIPDSPRLAAVLREAGGEGAYLYSLQSGPDSVDDIAAYTRFFNPTVGIWEDPATGTAAGPLAARLVALGRVPDGSTVAIEQGRHLGRPSILRVRVAGESVRLSGSGVVVASGILDLAGSTA
ncbi:PhzF family phenazine biosynthesis protein [Nakamurella silvestris]|nr:PhzF family phenazine biosynthesis protein [Nakamurella silvestris]